MLNQNTNYKPIKISSTDIETKNIILIFFFSQKTINTYLKLEIRFVCREFLAFKNLFIFFSLKQIR